MSNDKRQQDGTGQDSKAEPKNYEVNSAGLEPMPSEPGEISGGHAAYNVITDTIIG